MKRTVQFVLFLLCLFCAFGVAIYAAPAEGTYTDLEQTIYDGLLAREEAIDLSSFYVTQEDVSAAYQRVYYTSPDLFYVKIDATYTVTTVGDQIVKFKPPYNDMTADEIATATAFCEKTVSEMVAGVEADWSDLEKALYIHDHLALYYDYDQTLTIRGTYQFFTEGKGVCTAYALAFYAAMEELGIPVDVVTSDSRAHIWNVVQIDGAWYHVDVTWDDPTSADEMGVVAHENFLKSTAEFQTGDHAANDWVMTVTCTDTTYDTAFWDAVDSPFCYVNDTWYFMGGIADYNTTAIYSYDFATATATPCHPVGSRWTTQGGYYEVSFARLGAYKDLLYYSTPNAIMSYDPATGESMTTYTLQSASNGLIYNFQVRDNVAHYLTSTASGAAVTGRYTYTLVGRYTMTFYDSDGTTTLFTMMVDEGSTIILPDYEGKTQNHMMIPLASWQGYTPGMTATQNRSFVAVYDMDNITYVQYTYTFYAENGYTIIARFTKPYGTVIEAPAAPEKPADTVWKYTFAGWRGFTEGMTLAADVSFVATYDATPIATFNPTTNSPTFQTFSLQTLLTPPLLWIALGVVGLAILIPTLIVVTETKEKQKEKKSKANTDYRGDTW